MKSEREKWAKMTDAEFLQEVGYGIAIATNAGKNRGTTGQQAWLWTSYGEELFARLILAARSSSVGEGGDAAVVSGGRWRKKPVVVDAVQWFESGDHPEDNREWFHTEESGDFLGEGKVVRYYRRPDDPGTRECQHCGCTMHEHGWIDTLEGGHVVCPGDWIITGVQGERYPCKPDIFAATYEPATSHESEVKPAGRDLEGQRIEGWARRVDDSRSDFGRIFAVYEDGRDALPNDASVLLIFEPASKEEADGRR